VVVRIRPLELRDAADLAMNCFPELTLDEVEERVKEDLARIIHE